MTLVNYAYHAGVTDSKDFLSKLRTFAIAQGWDGSDYQTSVQWSSGWIVGTGDFLQLTSTCFGHCDKAVYRFYAYNVDANEDRLYNTAHTTSTYQSIATNPRSQDQWGGDNYAGSTNLFTYTSMPSSAQNIDKVWFFGSKRYIYAIAQFDDYWIPTWHLGSIDLYQEYQLRNDCAFWGCSCWNGGDTLERWDLHNEEYWHCGHLPSFPVYGDDYDFDCIYFSGQDQNFDDEGASYSFWNHGGRSGHAAIGSEEEGRYNFCNNVARTYGPNGRRISFKVDFFAQDIEGNGNIVALGKTPFYIIPFNGLTAGDTIDGDGYTFMCFPFKYTYMNIGYAFRIA